MKNYDRFSIIAAFQAHKGLVKEIALVIIVRKDTLFYCSRKPILWWGLVLLVPQVRVAVLRQEFDKIMTDIRR